MRRVFQQHDRAQRRRRQSSQRRRTGPGPGAEQVEQQCVVERDAAEVERHGRGGLLDTAEVSSMPIDRSVISASVTSGFDHGDSHDEGGLADCRSRH